MREIQERYLRLRECDFLASLTAEERQWVSRALIDVNVEKEHELICYCDECCEEADRRWEAKQEARRKWETRDGR